MFELRGIDKRFDAVVALKDASLSVKPGEIHALLGSNGSGKSTMIKVLAGLVNPNAGEVLIDETPVDIRNGHDSRKLGIATAFQDLSLIPTMSVRDNILLGNEPRNALGLVDRSACDEIINRLLERFHIDCDPDDYVQTLMPSTQTMLEVAKAVALKPRLLLLDEVSAALHYDEIQVLFSVMRELKEEGIAMVYVTHRMNEVFEICDRTTIMRSGESVITGPMNDFSLEDIVYYMTGQHPDKIEKDTSQISSDEGRELVLDVRNISIFPKVHDISLRAHKGEIVGIGGLQGQGQPEIIRAILGAIPFEEGEILYDGKSSTLKTPSEAVKKGIGFISGERNREAIFPARTVLENILAGKVAKGKMFAYMPAKTNRAFAKNAVDEYNIVVGSLNHPASSLSGGNQQKLVVARWIAMEPKLLLLDDPTRGVDIHSRLEIHEILKECANEGMTILISSSESEELLSLCDVIYVFYDGRVSAQLTGRNKTPEKLVAAMMGMSDDKEIVSTVEATA